MPCSENSNNFKNNKHYSKIYSGVCRFRKIIVPTERGSIGISTTGHGKDILGQTAMKVYPRDFFKCRGVVGGEEIDIPHSHLHIVAFLFTILLYIFMRCVCNTPNDKAMCKWVCGLRQLPAPE